jgi:hypothetical protein
VLDLESASGGFFLETSKRPASPADEIDVSVARTELWFSPNGAGWTRLRSTGLPSPSASEQISSLYAGDPPLVAAVRSSTGRLSVWYVTTGS